MKKLLAVLLALVMCVSILASCNLPGKNDETTPAETTPAETTPAETTTEAPAETTTGSETPDGPTEPTFDVEAAADYIYNLYKDKSITAADFDVTSKVAIEGIIHTVEWSVDTDKVTITQKNANTYTINVDETSIEEVAYVLTATITGGDQTATKSFNLIVPKFEVNTFEEYMAAQKGDTVTVAGVVVAINSKAEGNKYNHLFLADLEGKGGYYCYAISADPVADLGIELGMVVAVTGPIEPYSGMQEIKGGDAVIIDTTKHEVATRDITDMILNGESIANYVGTIVTIKNVEIAGQELGGTSEYLKFKVGETTAYVRTYITDFPTTLDTDKKAEIDATHAEHFGWTANATGILVLYNSNPYLIPVGFDCFEYLSAPQLSDAEMVTGALGQLSLGTNYSSDAVVELPAPAFPAVTFTWVSDNENVVVADGKLTITVPDAVTNVTVTVTATCGDVTETKTFTLKLSKVATPIKEIIDIALSGEHNVYSDSKYLVAGVITEVYNTTYGNMKITDEFGNILTIYGTYSADGSVRYDAMEGAPVAGDYVVIYGVVGHYNGTPQVKNGWIMSVTASTSVEDAINTGAAQEHNTYTADKYIVTGVITEVYNTQYGNMKITDGNGNILTIYGTYNADGTIRYDALEVKPVAGDTVTIYGSLGQYNGTAQIKNGWIVAHTAATPETPETPECTEHVDANSDEKCDNCGADVPAADTPVDPETPEIPAADSTLTVEQVIALGSAQEHNTYTEGKYYVTGVITEVYNTQYGNLKITDGNGNILTIYGTYSADGTVRYDALEVKPVAGDTITVYGIVGQYNGTPQVKNGWITAHTAATPETPVDPETPALNTTKEIYEAAAKLENNVTLEGTFTMTGVIASVDTAYDASFKNVTVTFVVDGYAFKCYRLAGEGADVIAAGDTITVTGSITAYYNAPQFAQGCTLVSYEKGEEKPADPNSLNISFESTANRTEFSTEIQVWVQNGITVTNNKAGATSNVADYSKPGRFYKGSEVIIECAGMTKIEINCFGLDSKYVNPWLNVTNGTATLENGIVTIVFETPVDSIVYSSLSAQARAYDITVYTQG